MEERRILDGRLDCPMCEARYPIRDGIVRLDEAAGGERREPEAAPARRPSGSSMPADAASLAAALLGAPDGSEILLLAGPAAELGAAVAKHRPEAVVVTWGSPPDVRHPRVHPVVPPEPAAIPRFRPGRLDGAVIVPGHGSRAVAIAPALKPGGRLVVLGPGAGFAAPADAGFEELASDSRAWVGVRR